MEDYSRFDYLGEIELANGEHFTVLLASDRLVFGCACNAGFLESGYMIWEDDDIPCDTGLSDLIEDLEAFYRDGREHCSRIVCNERM